MLDSALWKIVDGADKENHSGIKQDQWVFRFSKWPTEKSLAQIPEWKGVYLWLKYSIISGLRQRWLPSRKLLLSRI